jgi:hypothetical protein
MPLYQTTGALHDPRITEGTEALTDNDRENLAILTAQRQNLETFAANVAGLASIPEIVAVVNTAVTTVGADAARAETAADRAVGVDTSAAASANLAQAWASKDAEEVENGLFSAREYARQASLAGEGLDDAILGIEEDRLAAEAARDAARGFASGAVDTALPDGSFSSRHWAEQARRIASRAAAVHCTTLTDATSSPYTLLARDLYHGVVVNRSTPIQVVYPIGLYQGPPDPGYDYSLAWTQFANIGAADMTLIRQGAGGGGTTQVFQPSITVSLPTGESNGSATPIVSDLQWAFTAPAGESRKFAIVAFDTWTNAVGTTPVGVNRKATPVVVSGPVTNFLFREKAGSGDPTATNPVQCEVYTGEITGTAEVAISLRLDYPVGLVRSRAYLVVMQNAAAVTAWDTGERTGSSAQVTATLTPPDPASHIFFGMAFQTSTIGPLTIDRGSVLEAHQTNNTTTFDLSAVYGSLPNQPASAQAIIATATGPEQAAWGGVVFTPRSVTVPGTGDGLIKKGAQTNVVPTGGQAYAAFGSDGTTVLWDNA